jgi:polyisoprenoid-binding protein YceI
MIRIFRLGAAACLLVFAHGAYASPMVLPLTAGNMLAQTHSTAIVMTVTGTFRQLTGTMNFDPDQKTCHLDVTFVVRSLELPNALVRSQTMSADFLDPDEYPEQRYVGDCEGGTLVGNLTMRGQTHPFNMQLTDEIIDGRMTGIHTEGTLNRYDWGLNGHTMTVGKMIRVTNDISVNGQPPVAH